MESEESEARGLRVESEVRQYIYIGGGTEERAYIL